MKILAAIKTMDIAAKASIILILLLLLVSLISGIVPGDAYKVPSGASLEAPSATHPLGTDDLGIDLLAQLCKGASTSLAIGFGAALLSGLGGSALGILSGYKGGKTDAFIMALCDIMMCLPRLPILIVLGAFFGAGIRNIIVVIALMSWTESARLIRAKVLSIRNDYYIIAAKSYGARFPHLLCRHFLPLLTPLVVVNLMRIISHAIISEAGLSFLGLGDPTSKSWGVIINRAMNFPGIYFTPFWKWWLLPPLCALIVLVLAVAAIGRSLEKLQNQKL